ncbi:MAG: ribosome-associated translation inhibitor RaiA [Clostridia bacterium]|nr:ribosome-associated translation inhibitor RaiA [Clostridia bacterium]
MKITITGKNVKVTDKINEAVEKKFSKIEKCFSGDTEAKILIRPEGDKVKFEATILGKGFNLRAESVRQDIFDAIEDASNRLNSQMAKVKGKMEHRYQGIESIRFEMLPEEEDAPKIVKTKKHRLAAMNPEDATIEMELLGHDFYLFVNEETDTVCAVYKRNDGDYGLLETDY